MDKVQKITEKEILLDHNGVAEIGRETEEWLGAVGVTKATAAKTAFIMEDLMLRISDHYDQDINVTMTLGKHFGTPYMRIRYGGQPYNPLDEDESSFEKWTGYLTERMGVSPGWSYHHRKNELILREPRRGTSMEFMMLVAALLAAVFGLTGSSLPESIREFISLYIFSPVSDVFMSLLGLFAGLLIFLSVVTGICGIGSASEFGRVGKLMLSRFLSLTFIGCVICILMARPFFKIAPSMQTEGSSAALHLIEMIKGIIPGDPISPFLNNNTLQLVFMAMVLGIIILLIGNEAAGFTDFLFQFNKIVTRGITAVCKLLPLYIFCSVTLQFWESGVEVFIKLYKPLLICILISAAFVIIKAVTVGLSAHVSPVLLLGKIFPAMIIGLTTASSSAAFGTMSEIDKDKLGIDDHLDNMGIPIGAVLYCSSYTALFVLLAFYSAESYGVGGGLDWYVMAWLVCSIVAMACPPVSGGMLVCMGVLFSQLGIPSSAIAIATTLSILMDFICTGARVGLLQMELTWQANKLGLIDKKILQDPET